MLTAKIVDGPSTLGDQDVVVDDQVAAGGEAGVEGLEADPRRLVGVAIKPDDGPAVSAEGGQGLVEEPLDQLNALLAAEASEMAPHLLGRHGKELHLAQVQIVVLGKPARVGAGQSLERVGDPHQPVVRAERVEGRAGEDRGATPPRAGLDHVAVDPVGDDRLDARLEIVEPLGRPSSGR